MSVFALVFTLGVGNAWGEGSITVSSSTIILPKGSTSVSAQDWQTAAGFKSGSWPSAYSDWEGDQTIGSYGTINFSSAGELGDSGNSDYLLALQASGGTFSTVISSPAGVDIVIECKKGSKGTMTISLTGADAQTYSSESWGTVSISTTSTSATFTVSKTGKTTAGVKYIQITPKSAATCSADPTIGSASLNGAFN